MIIRKPLYCHFIARSEQLVFDNVTTKCREHFSAFVAHLHRRNMGSQSSSDTDTRSSTSSPLSDDNFSGFLQDSNEFGLLAYHFEPERVLSSDGSNNEDNEKASNEEIQNDRLSSSNWYGFNNVGILFSY